MENVETTQEALAVEPAVNLTAAANLSDALSSVLGEEVFVQTDAEVGGIEADGIEASGDEAVVTVH